MLIDHRNPHDNHLLKYNLFNYQTPVWDCEVELQVPESNFNTVSIKVFDEDTLGKDKSLGKTMNHELIYLQAKEYYNNSNNIFEKRYYNSFILISTILCG